MASRINILDETIAARIAAGEVITNPAAVVKELLENSIDSGATAVTIEISDGGKELIRVTDNGSGIHAEDVPLAIKKHTTSKIKEYSDLLSIGTLGFRGEALFSMSSVARLTIRTQQKGADMGTILSVSGGGEVNLTSAGLPEGTTVIIENLFYNVPARKKFLKGAGQEASAITNIVSKIILSDPNLAVKYINNGRTIYQSPGNGDLTQAIATVFGKDIYTKIMPVSYEYENIFVEGFISNPTFLYKNMGNMLFYLNGRYIQSKQLQQALIRGYGERILKSHYPFAVLNIKLPYDFVDVNVHPTKLQVMFFRESFVLDALTRATATALKGSKIPILNIIDEQNNDVKKGHSDYIKQEQSKPVSLSMVEERATESVAMPTLNSADRLYKKPIGVGNSAEQIMADYDSKLEDAEKKDNYVADSVMFAPSGKFEEVLEEIAAEKSPIVVQEEIQDVREMINYKVLGQAFGVYIVCESADTLYFIDQHAAHERITYEAIKNQLKNSERYAQQLLIPVIVQFNQADYDRLMENMEFLEEIGFSAEEFGPLSIKFSALPAVLGQVDSNTLIDDVLFEIKNNHKDVVLLREKVIRAACRSSIKGGDALSELQINALISELTNSDVMPTCPHGRPIAIAITKNQLQKGFKRIV